MDRFVRELDVVDILVEFLEASIHNLLFLRKLYPSGIFVLRKIYNVPVQVSKHPDLNHYITQTLNSARILLRRKQLKSLAVCFYDGSGQPIDRFVFNILGIQEKFKPSQDFTDPYLTQLREGMRAFCLKLSTCSSKPVDQQSSFQIHFLTTEQGSQALAKDPNFEDFPWVELESQEKDLAAPRLVPIRTIESDFLKLQLYWETVSV